MGDLDNDLIGCWSWNVYLLLGLQRLWPVLDDESSARHDDRMSADITDYRKVC